MWVIGEQQALLSEDEDSKLQWAWELAACRRGFDCSERAAWREVLCRSDYNCQPGETGVDLIRRGTGSDFDEIERIALELEGKVETGAFGQLGL